MEIRTLRYLLAMVREENMIRAAKQLHVTQPTLSKQMRSLERELGDTFFIHCSFSTALAEEGRLLRCRAEDLVAMADCITDESLELDDVLGGGLYFGLAESHQVRLLTCEIKCLKEDCPGMRYYITSGDTEQVIEKLDRGLLDFAALVEGSGTARYETLNLLEADRWGIVTRADGELARKARVNADDLEGLLLFCSEQSWVADLPRWVGVRVAEFHLEGIFQLAYNGSVFAREGLGHPLTFTRLVDTGEDNGLAFRPLWPVLESPIYLIWHRQQVLSPTVRRFLTQVSTALEEENTSAGRHWSPPLAVKCGGNHLHAPDATTSTPEGTTAWPTSRR